MKERFGKLDVAAMLMVATFIWAPLLAAPFQGVAKPIGGEPQQSIANQVWNWICRPSLTDWFLVCVGGGQLVVYGRQSRISERQVGIVEALERPLVLPLGPRIGMLGYRDNSNKSRFPEIEMNFINHGRSPAVVQYAMTGIIVGCKFPERQHAGNGFWSAFWIDDRGKRHLEFYTKHFWTNPALSPGETLEWGDIQQARALDPTQMDELGTGHQTLWLDGVIVYLDVFGKSRETHFRWVYDYVLDIMVVDAKSPEFNRYT